MAYFCCGVLGVGAAGQNQSASGVSRNAPMLRARRVRVPPGTALRLGSQVAESSVVVKRLSVSELLRLACLYAEQDRRSWLDAMRNCTGAEDADASGGVWCLGEYERM